MTSGLGTSQVWDKEPTHSNTVFDWLLHQYLSDAFYEPDSAVRTKDTLLQYTTQLERQPQAK